MNMMLSKVKIILTAVALASLTGSSAQSQVAAPPPATQAPDTGAIQQKMQRLQSAQAELQRVQSTLAPVQVKAAETPKVKATYEKLEATYFETMAEKAPAMEEQIEEMKKLTDELRDNKELQAPADERSPEINAKLKQYQRIKQQLTPIEQQVLRDPEVAELSQEYQTVLLAAMHEVNPRAKTLVERQQELALRVQTIRREIQQEQASQQPSPPQEQPQAPQGQP